MMKKYSVLAVIGLLVLSVIIFEYRRQLLFQKDNQLKINQFAKIIEIDKRREEPLKLPILVYHYIEIVTDTRDTIRKSLSITPAVFESQILELKKANFTPITLDNLLDYYNGKNVLPKNPIIFTFDDGYKDFYTDVLPILKKYQLPAVLYVTSHFLNSTNNYLTQKQLVEISNSGLIEIGAHGVNHYNLAYSDYKTQEYEIKQSQQELEKILNRPIKHFAYPYGGYSTEVIKMLNSAGFLTSATMDHSVVQTYENRFLLKRIRPGSSTGDYFLSLLK